MNDVSFENDHYKMILRYLDWDSKVLNMKCGSLGIIKKRDNDNSFNLIFDEFKNFKRLHQYKFITIKFDANDICTVNKLLQKGFLLIDTELTFLKTLSSDNIIDYKCDDSVIISKKEKFWDDSLFFISDNLSKSRFFVDPNICNDKAKELWDKSIYNHCNGRADYLIVSQFNDEVAGLMIINDVTNIFVICVLPAFQNKGIASKMFAFLENNVVNNTIIKVETQLINYSAQSLYTRMGYKNTSAKYVFHYWN